MIPTREQFESIIVAHGTPGIRDEQRLRLYTAMMLTYDALVEALGREKEMVHHKAALMIEAHDERDRMRQRVQDLEVELARYAEAKDEIQRLTPGEPAATVTDCTTYEAGRNEWKWGIGTFSCERKLDVGTKLYEGPPAP